MNKHYEAILFDFDGVIVDSEPVHYACWSEILRPYGFDLDWETYVRNCVGVSDRKMLENFAAEVGPPVELDMLVAEYPRKKQMFRQRMETADVLHPDTDAFLRGLDGYKLAVVSSSARPEVEPTLVRFGLRERFDVLVCGWEAAKLKPAPDPYLKAAELLGVTRALVVEDSAAGEASGRAAGFDVVRISAAADMADRVRAALNGNGARS